MYLVAIAWLYVALMMGVAEAGHPDGTLLGAAITFLLYGVGPLALVLYILGTPARRRARRAREEAEARVAAQPDPAQAGSAEPDAGGQPAAAAEPGLVAPVREKP